jgi:hypothetical protein
MTDQPLSPAAQAVLDAFTGNDTIHGLHLMTPRLAAVLQAAADQVVPDEPYCSEDDSLCEYLRRTQRQETRAGFLAIAAELRAK